MSLVFYFFLLLELFASDKEFATSQELKSLSLHDLLNKFPLCPHFPVYCLEEDVILRLVVQDCDTRMRNISTRFSEHDFTVCFREQGRKKRWWFLFHSKTLAEEAIKEFAKNNVHDKKIRLADLSDKIYLSHKQMGTDRGYFKFCNMRIQYTHLQLNDD